MEIKLLEKNVYNKISAGEVVEKPASIVKELVENSLDAGAKNITIEIKNGGIDYISVSDDGCGINSQDVELAFMAHATSKLSVIEDLQTLNSKGFRGEALASIAAISFVEMTTRTNNEDTAIKINIQGGDVVEKLEVASLVGTKIVVSNLFYNTPVRLKFLRKPKTEEGDITVFVEKLILSNSNVNFKYIIDGIIKYNTINCSLIDNIYAIYGVDISKNLIQVDYNKNNIRVYGYISKPTISKSNRTYQSLFVNGRYCLNSVISASIASAYGDFLMKGKFPIYCLFLEMPPNSVDINVHPNKLEVKFENSGAIYAIFNSAVYEALSGDTQLISSDDIDMLVPSAPVNVPIPNVTRDEGITYKETQKTDDESYSEYLKNKQIKESTKYFAPETISSDNNFVFESKMNNLKEIYLTHKKLEDKAITAQENFAQTKIEEKEAYENLFSDNRRIVGTAFKTYIIIEEGDNLYLIDQHAAHERQIYDMFKAGIDDSKIDVTNILVPFILNVNEVEYNFIENNLDILRSYGFGIEAFGKNCFKIVAVPILLTNINLKEYFDEILTNMDILVKKPFDIIKEKFMQMACKSAVKAGDVLSKMEINSLIVRLKENKNVLLCPHGRPIVIILTKKQIEKSFKRVL